MSKINKNLRIAVLRGGPSSEYEVSLKTGAAIINALADDGEESAADDVRIVVDILIDKAGKWHRSGIPMCEADALKGVDVVVIAMHGEYGEDGTVQRVLEKLGMPFAGSGSYASALAMHKPRARFAASALPMVKFPEHYVVREDDGDDYDAITADIFARFGPPYIVKPALGGSSVGLAVAKSVTELAGAIEYVARVGGYPVLVEQMILGRETTCGVVEDYRGEKHYALPPIEIIPPKEKGGIFDYEAKYSTDTALCAQEICPANFTKAEKSRIEEAAKAVHCALELRHYSRSDFILSPHGLYFLEANTLPGLTESSLLPKSIDTVGSNLKEFLEHIIELALNRK